MAEATTPSKRSQAVEIFKGMPGAARKDVIAAIQSQLGMSKAGASTYYQHAKDVVSGKKAPKA